MGPMFGMTEDGRYEPTEEERAQWEAEDRRRFRQAALHDASCVLANSGALASDVIDMAEAFNQYVLHGRTAEVANLTEARKEH